MHVLLQCSCIINWFTIHVLVCQGCHSKILQTGWLNRNLIFHSQSLEIHGQGVSYLVSYGVSVWLAVVTFLLSSHMVFFVCPNFLLLKGHQSDRIQADQGPSQQPHFNFITSLQSYLQTQSYPEALAVRAPTHEFLEHMIHLKIIL